MTDVDEGISKTTPLAKAAMLLAARAEAADLGLPHPKSSDIVAATGAGRARAYELAAKIPQAVSGLIRPPGRPPKPAPEPAPEEMAELRRKVIDHLIDNPGCVTTRGLRTWARTLNHKPRGDRHGQSRVDIYREAEPTEQDVEHARKALRDRARKQQRMLETLRARRDPVVRAAIDELWDEVDLDDPGGKVRDAISSYPLDDVVAGIAICRGKRDAGTLPEGVDARYLFGVVRNVSEQREGQAITEALLRIRVAARDVMLRRLIAERDNLLASNPEPDALLRDAVHRAMDTTRLLDRLFWLDLVADTIRDQDPATHGDLVKAASRRIHASFAVPYRDRLAAVRFLVERVVPLA